MRYKLVNNWCGSGDKALALLDTSIVNPESKKACSVIWSSDPGYRISIGKNYRYDSIGSHNNLVMESDNLQDILDFIFVDIL